jgi:predicted enzyme related to lactoylglutathione lyase
MGLVIWKPTLDCADLDVTTAFWTWLLGVEVSLENGNIRFLGAQDGPPVMCLQQVAEPRLGKNRMHLDLVAPNLDAAVADVAHHGGARLSEVHELPAGRWREMSDPEGNEFCLVEFAAVES